ncbi:MAG: hypothetical protein ACYCSF_08145 [Acidimicrobiales bacterium]
MRGIDGRDAPSNELVLASFYRARAAPGDPATARKRPQFMASRTLADDCHPHAVLAHDAILPPADEGD